MFFWGQLGFQESFSVTMELLNYFHDYMMMLLTIIMIFVSYVFLCVIFSNSLDKFIMDSHVLETVWTIVPMVVLCFMAFPSLFLLYLMEDSSGASFSVKVIGHQWYWEYEYAFACDSSIFNSYMLHSSVSDQFLFHALDVDNRLVLPSFTKILFLVTSVDVLHSWTVPSLGIKVDAIPGRLNYLVAEATDFGVLYGQCSEICGSNHSYMPISLEFVEFSCFTSFMSSFVS